MTRDERCWGPLLEQQLWSYCLGLSLRDLQEALRLTLGEGRSLEACHRLVLGWEKQVEGWKTRRLESPPPMGSSRTQQWAKQPCC
jgi:hypothetical protein